MANSISSGVPAYAVVYQYWGKYDCLDFNCPIILAIATLRARHPEMPIYVLDSSNLPLRWYHYPDKLNFKVVKYRHVLRRQFFKGNVFWRFVSRIYDLEQFSKQLPQENIIFCDSDIFWIKDLLPLACINSIDRFCCRPENGGFFYFNKGSDKVREFFRRYKVTAERAIQDRTFREEIWRFCSLPVSNTQCLHDEMIHYFSRNEEFNCDIPMLENQRLKPGISPEALMEAKNLHLMRVFWPQNRALAASLIEEIRIGVRSVLSDDEIDRIVTPIWRGAQTYSLSRLAEKAALEALMLYCKEFVPPPRSYIRACFT